MSNKTTFSAANNHHNRLSVLQIIHFLDLKATPLSITYLSPKAQPPSGAVILYDRTVARKYKQDGYRWVKKRNSKNVREDHVKLRINGVERVAGAYVHCVDNRNFHRRTYHLLTKNKQRQNLVLVHYLDTYVSPYRLKAFFQTCDEKNPQGPLNRPQPLPEFSSVSPVTIHQITPEKIIGTLLQDSGTNRYMNNGGDERLTSNDHSILHCEQNFVVGRSRHDLNYPKQYPTDQGFVEAKKLIFTNSPDKSQLHGASNHSIEPTNPFKRCRCDSPLSIQLFKKTFKEELEQTPLIHVISSNDVRFPEKEFRLDYCASTIEEETRKLSPDILTFEFDPKIEQEIVADIIMHFNEDQTLENNEHNLSRS